MQITKLGHCCLLIKEKSLTIMTDPGNYSTAQDSVTGVDCVIISHEHTDHLHVESLRNVLRNNPQAKIVTNSAVAAILDRENIATGSRIIVGHGQSTTIGAASAANQITIAGWGTKHAPIYQNYEQVENTGYIIGDRLFYPGDALTLLDRKENEQIEILALPVAGPWLTISDALEYALAVKPKKCIPVHDGNLRSIGLPHRLPKLELAKAGIDFIAMTEGQTVDFG